MPPCCVRCMADMPPGVLSTDPIEYILQLLLRRAPYPPPSDPASQHRAAIVSSSLDQGSPAERISSSLALCQDFGFGFGLVFRPCLRTGPFFCPAARRFNPHQSGTQSANRRLIFGRQQLRRPVDRLPQAKMHGRHVDLSIADQMVKTYIGFVAGDAAPYPPPSDPRLGDIGSRPYPPPSTWVHPVRCISSSLAPGYYSDLASALS